MKSIVLLLAFVLGIGLECVLGQTEYGDNPFMLDYNGHFPEEMKKFAEGTLILSTELSVDRELRRNVFLNFLFQKTGETDLDLIFSRISVQWRVLDNYNNSCWNIIKDKMKPYPGKHYEGYVAVYNDGYKEIVLWKINCGNLLDVAPKILVALKNEDLSKRGKIYYVDTETEEVNIRDTIAPGNYFFFLKKTEMGERYYSENFQPVNWYPLFTFRWGYWGDSYGFYRSYPYIYHNHYSHSKNCFTGNNYYYGHRNNNNTDRRKHDRRTIQPKNPGRRDGRITNNKSNNRVTQTLNRRDGSTKNDLISVTRTRNISSSIKRVSNATSQTTKIGNRVNSRQSSATRSSQSNGSRGSSSSSSRRR